MKKTLDNSTGMFKLRAAVRETRVPALFALVKILRVGADRLDGTIIPSGQRVELDRFNQIQAQNRLSLDQDSVRFVNRLTQFGKSLDTALLVVRSVGERAVALQ